MMQSRWAPKPDKQTEDVERGSASTTAGTAKEVASNKTITPTEITPSLHEHSSSKQDLAQSPSRSASPQNLASFIPIERDGPQFELARSEQLDSNDFAQTAGDEDDLFDDPPDESMRVRDDDDLFSDDIAPITTEAPVTSQQVMHSKTGEPDASISEELAAKDLQAASLTNMENPSTKDSGSAATGKKSTESARHHDVASASKHRKQQPPRQADPPANAPLGPKKESVPSVRGDRQATGGIKKPKLTEEELEEKMARIQIKNATLTAAHERAEADAASFAERESQAKLAAAQRQKVERRDRQQMMGEREKNRLRKLKAMEGREWDAEKNEDDFGRGSKFDRKGGFSGDKPDYSDGREYLLREPRGHGDHAKGERNQTSKNGRGGIAVPPKAPPKQEDFPALPGAKPSDKMSAPIASWADQVENA